MGIFQLNKLSRLHNGKTIHFVKTDYVLDAIKKIKDSEAECCIITGNSDYPITEHHIELALSAGNIKKWYGQNMSVTGLEIAQGIPCGVTNTDPCSVEGNGMPFPHERKKLGFLFDDGSTPTKDLYANFGVGTNTERPGIMAFCHDIEWIDTGYSLPYEDYYREARDHRMILCPEGNGVDTCRFWETIYIGRIPIAKKSNVMSYFYDLPAIFLDDWSSLEDRDFIMNKYSEAQKKKSDVCLSCPDYWTSKILEDSARYE